jgi:signal transduction histidine kinase
MIVAFYWGIGLACHAFAVAAPRLRQRFVDQEVSRRLQHSVTRERRVLEGEHARSLEELSASIAHEIRNPITAAKSLVQQMGEDPRASDNVEYARVALDELDRVERSIAHLLRFAREEPLRLASVRLSDAFTGALEVLADRVTRSGVEIVRDFDGSDRIDGDAEKLRRIAINLVANAIDAIEQARPARPRLELSTGLALGGREVVAAVRDNGIGMADTDLARIFQPFYTAKEHGTGLGLPLVKKLVEAHGGSVEVRSARGVGSEFALTFPAPRPEGGTR